MDVECDKCGKIVSADKVKIDTKNKWYVCLDCVGAAELAGKKKYEHTKIEDRGRVTSKIRVVCTYCGYPYMFDTWKKYPRECPYCGKKDSNLK